MNTKLSISSPQQSRALGSSEGRGQRFLLSIPMIIAKDHKTAIAPRSWLPFTLDLIKDGMVVTVIKHGMIAAAIKDRLIVTLLCL